MKLPAAFKRTIKTLDPLEGYDRWAATYSTESNPVKALSDGFVGQHFPPLTGKTFLDVGCGTGKFCLKAAHDGAAQVTGVDLSSEMIAIAKQSSRSIDWIEGDLLHVNLKKQTYDVIVCALVLAHITDLAGALQKLFYCIKPGGLLIITDFHPHQTLMKARRTFRHAGKTFEIRHHLHLFDEYFKICKEHDAEIIDFQELKYGEAPVVFGMSILKR